MNWCIGPLRRVRVFAGHFALLGALGLVAALLATGVPRLANGYADHGLRQDLGGLPYQTRDLRFTRALAPDEPVDPAAAAEQLGPIRQRLPAPLPGLIGQEWFAGQIGPDGLDATGDGPALSGGCRARLSLRAQPGLDRTADLVSGRWPASAGPAIGADPTVETGPTAETDPTVETDPTAEAAISREAADTLGLRVGSRATLTGENFSPGSVDVRIVGVYQPTDLTAPAWDAVRLAPAACPSTTEGDTWRVPLLTDLAGLASAAEQLRNLTYEWRYRVDEQRLTTAGIPGLLAAVGQARRPDVGDPLRLATGLDGALSTFDGQLRAVRALLAVVQAGILGTVLGLVVLAARLAVERRREEFGLIRARGGAVLAIGGRTLRESVLVLPVAVLAGWALGTRVPGRPAGVELPLVAALLVGTALAVPLLAALGQRRASVVGRRRDLVRHRPSGRRLTAEALVLLLAVLGVVLLRRRGLDQASGVDPYLVSVPVLLAVAAAVVALRLVPWPLRRLGALAGRARTAVPFLGLARAGRGSPAIVAPLAVLVVAIATGVFTGVVTSTVDAARDRVSDQEVAGDVRLTAADAVPETSARLAALPGVAAVSPVAAEPGQPLRSSSPDLLGGRDLGQAQVLVMDGPSLARVLARSGVGMDLPATFTRPDRIDGPVPAAVSPEVAAALGGPGAEAVAEVQGRRYAFTVGTVTSTFPGLAVGARRFVALPWQALPVPDFQPIRPNQFLVAGDGYSTADLTGTVEAGQREYLARLLRQPADAVRPSPVSVTTWSAHRRALERSGVNRLLGFTLGAGVAGTVTLALLAVGFAVLAEAPGRGRVLSRLRTMGLSPRQGRGLLVYELVPLIGVAVLSGGLVGVALPRLLGPALGLSSFTGGLPARIHLDPLLVVGVLLLMVAAVAVALSIENLINRRMRLGEVLRLGEEM